MHLKILLALLQRNKEVSDQPCLERAILGRGPTPLQQVSAVPRVAIRTQPRPCRLWLMLASFWNLAPSSRSYPYIQIPC